MGALTSKTYTYKGRPWELRSKDTISLKDPFLPNIRAQIIHKKILRLLPVVGEEEWLGNHSRFFESRNLNTTYLGVLHLQWNSNIIKNVIKESDGYQRSMVLEKTLTSMSKDILEKRELTFILGPETDITVQDAIKELDAVTPAIDIFSIIPNATKEIQNAKLDEDDLKNNDIVLMTSKLENSPLFSAKLEDFVEEGGNFSRFNLSYSKKTTEASYGLAKSTLNGITTGSSHQKMSVLAFLPAYFESYLLSSTKKLFVADPVHNSALRRNTIQEVNYTTNIITSVSAVNMGNRNITTYFAGPTVGNLLKKDLVIPTLSFWNEVRIYKDLFGKSIETPIILNIPQNISFVDAIIALQKKLLLLLSFFMFYLDDMLCYKDQLIRDAYISVYHANLSKHSYKDKYYSLDSFISGLICQGASKKLVKRMQRYLKKEKILYNSCINLEHALGKLSVDMAKLLHEEYFRAVRAWDMHNLSFLRFLSKNMQMKPLS